MGEHACSPLWRVGITMDVNLSPAGCIRQADSPSKRTILPDGPLGLPPSGSSPYHLPLLVYGSSEAYQDEWRDEAGGQKLAAESRGGSYRNGNLDRSLPSQHSVDEPWLLG